MNNKGNFMFFIFVRVYFDGKILLKCSQFVVLQCRVWVSSVYGLSYIFSLILGPIPLDMWPLSPAIKSTRIQKMRSNVFIFVNCTIHPINLVSIRTNICRSLGIIYSLLEANISNDVFRSSIIAPPIS